MKTAVKKLSDTRIEIKVTLEPAELKPARDKALARLARDLKVEGFRKGKVPIAIAAKFIPDNDLNSHALDIAIRASVFEAFAKNEKSPLAVPEINVTKYVPNEMAEYTAVAEILPEIKLADFTKLKVKKPEAKISDADIKDVLANLAGSFAEKSPVKRPAANTDEVVIDFVGKKAGVAFDGGTAKGYKLILGSKSFIPGFEEGIIGHKIGETFDLPLTFPSDYGVSALAGAKTVFTITLNAINAVTPVKIDDDLAKKCGPFKSLAELKADIKKNLAAQDEHRLMEKYKDDLVAALVEKSKIVAPEILIKDQLRFIKDDLDRNAAAAKQSIEEYLKSAGEDPKNWETRAREIAEKRVKASLALQVLARDHKITVDDKLVDAKIAELRDVYKKSPKALKSLKDPNVRMDLKNRMIIEKTIDFLVKAQK